MKEKSRWRKRKRKCMALTFVIFMTGTLCACGDKKPVDIIEEETVSKEEGSLKERMNIPDQQEFSYLTEQGVEKTVVADVVMSDVSSVGIYELEAVELTTDYMESVCRMFFDSGEYTILWPSYIYSKEELQEQYDAVSGEIDVWTDDSYQSNFLLGMDYVDLKNRVENYKDEWDSYVVSKPGERLVLYPAPRIEDIDGLDEDFVNGLPKELNTFDAYQYVTAEGTIGGRDARIQFVYDSIDDSYHISTYFDRDYRNGWNAYEKERVTKMHMKEAHVYTEEEAAQMAFEYVEMAGLTDMHLIHTAYLSNYDHEMPENSGYDAALTGYRFAFGLCQNNMPMLYDPGYKGIVLIDIGPEGLEGMYIHSPYRIVSSMAQESELLSFSKINEALDTMIEDTPGYYDIVDEIEFGYVVQIYENGSALVPAWNYTWLGTDMDVTLFTINAVDGSSMKESPREGIVATSNDRIGLDTTYWPLNIFYSE